MSQYRRRNRRISRARRKRLTISALVGVALVVLLVVGLRALFYRAPAGEGPVDTVSKAVVDGNQSEAEPEDEFAVEDEQADNVGETEPTPTPEAIETELPEEEEPVETEATKAPAATKKASTGTGQLPIIYRKKDETKKIAITIDDCFDAKNMRTIIKLAEKYNAGLTFFPKGSTIKGNADLWKEIYEKGYEIENHSYPHTNVSKLNNEKLRAAIVDSEKALNEALGVNYHMRLFRCPTGDGMRANRLHKILRQLGYEGVASWDQDSKTGADHILKTAKAGQIMLFHATDADVTRLKKIIPALVDKGYELVSVNDLYGKGPNEVTPLETYDH